jgi:hypothetical protein
MSTVAVRSNYKPAASPATMKCAAPVTTALQSTHYKDTRINFSSREKAGSRSDANNVVMDRLSR